MEKVLVTGATGFIGANIVRRLLKNSYEVHVLTRRCSDMWRLKGVYDDLIDHKVDLKDIERLSATIDSIQPDNIIHLAIFGGRPNEQNELAIIENNLIGTINLLTALENVNYKCFINTGSSSEYGKKKIAMSEDDICEPTGMYGISKASATMYCQNKAKSLNTNIGTLRLFSPYGYFEDRGRLIPDLIVEALTTKTVNLANPEAVRDFIFIDDVCDIYMKIIKNPEKLKGEIFNIGYGQQYSVKDVAETVKSNISNEVVLNFNSKEGRSSDSLTWVSNINKIKRIYGWEPEIDIKEGIKKSIDWFRENINLYQFEEKK